MTGRSKVKDGIVRRQVVLPRTQNNIHVNIQGQIVHASKCSLKFATQAKRNQVKTIRDRGAA
jgi:hypothetical protein